MKVAHHLIEVVSQACESGIIQFFDLVRSPAGRDRRIRGIQHQRATEMDGTHADGFGALPDARKLACREAEIELLVAWFRFG